ncbi:hypothetical protein EON77_05970, partial [bacterium]
ACAVRGEGFVLALDLSRGAGTFKEKLLVEGDEEVLRDDGVRERVCDVRPGEHLVMKGDELGEVLSLTRKALPPPPPKAAGGGEAEQVLMTTERWVTTLLLVRTKTGNLVKTTPEHPFFVEGRGFVRAGSLKPGDVLVTKEPGKTVEVLGTEEQRVAPTPVYNMSVRNRHTYFVSSEGLLVHNTGGGPGECGAGLANPDDENEETVAESSTARPRATTRKKEGNVALATKEDTYQDLGFDDPKAIAEGVATEFAATDSKARLILARGVMNRAKTLSDARRANQEQIKGAPLPRDASDVVAFLTQRQRQSRVVANVSEPKVYRDLGFAEADSKSIADDIASTLLDQGDITARSNAADSIAKKLTQLGAMRRANDDSAPTEVEGVLTFLKSAINERGQPAAPRTANAPQQTLQQELRDIDIRSARTQRDLGLTTEGEKERAAEAYQAALDELIRSGRKTSAANDTLKRTLRNFINTNKNLATPVSVDAIVAALESNGAKRRRTDDGNDAEGSNTQASKMSHREKAQLARKIPFKDHEDLTGWMKTELGLNEANAREVATRAEAAFLQL